MGRRVDTVRIVTAQSVAMRFEAVRFAAARFVPVRRAAIAAVAALVAGILVGIAPRAVAATATAGQIVTVTAAHATSTTATVELWSRNVDGSYHLVHGPYSAHVGVNGVGPTHEGAGRTPVGVFTLTQAFGNQASNGTRLPYFRAGPRDWWDENPASPTYNRHVVRTSSPGGASENLYTTGAAYAHAVVIDYNMHPVVKGAGSGFFIHVSTGHATAGCVSLASGTLDTVMRWLDPALHPIVSIGVGSAGTAPVTQANALAKHNPFGHLDALTARPTFTGGRALHVAGWAVDPDARATPLRIDFYSDGVRIGSSVFSVARPDVAKAESAGPRQGFLFDRPLSGGLRTICVVAVNIRAGTGNPQLGCRALDFG